MKIPRRPLSAPFKQAIRESSIPLEELARAGEFANLAQLRDLLAAPDVRFSSNIAACFARLAQALDYEGPLFDTRKK